MSSKKPETTYKTDKCEICSSDVILIHPSKWNEFKFPTWVCPSKKCGHLKRVVDETKLLIPERKTYPFWKAYAKLCREHGCIIEARNESSLEILTDTSYLDQHLTGLDPLR